MDNNIYKSSNMIKQSSFQLFYITSRRYKSMSCEKKIYFSFLLSDNIKWKWTTTIQGKMIFQYFSRLKFFI